MGQSRWKWPTWRWHHHTRWRECQSSWDTWGCWSCDCCHTASHCPQPTRNWCEPTSSAHTDDMFLYNIIDNAATYLADMHQWTATGVTKDLFFQWWTAVALTKPQCLNATNITLLGCTGKCYQQLTNNINITIVKCNMVAL